MAKASIKRLIENGVIDNLRKCAEVCAERGDYTGTIKTTKSLMKIAKKIDDEIVDIRTEYCKADTDGPPKDGEDNIADLKGKG